VKAWDIARLARYDGPDGCVKEMSMSNGVIDLRSDTVTRPTPAMRQAIAAAEVGDDVLEGDPTVGRLEKRVADLLGKEAALFVASGTMANQTAIRAHTQHGDEILMDDESHAYYYECGAPAAISGCSFRFIQSRRGIFTADDVRAALKPYNIHFARQSLLIIENTHNRGGGSIWPVENLPGIRELADQNGLKMHMDGARLMNACVAGERKPTDYTRYFDSISMCFSKGLGAPVGSAVAGGAEFISKVKVFRKMFGGAMRQSGILAAAALYALDHNIDRLADDHANARRLAEGLARLPGITINPPQVETNIVIFDIAPDLGTGASFATKLKDARIWMLASGPQKLRAVTHLDVTREQIEDALLRIRKIVA
jgi:threonine aldolase